MDKYAPTAMGLLAPIEMALNDPLVSEILINRPQEIYIEKKGSMVKIDVPEFNERHLEDLCALIAAHNEQTLDEEHPLLSGSLPDGTRVQIVLPPTAKHYTISIRRKVARHFTLDDYSTSAFYQEVIPASIEGASLDSLMPEEKKLLTLYDRKKWDIFIRKSIEYRKNIVISGGTSSGKTTYLNACLQHIPHNDRLVIIEDTREVEAPHDNQVQLLASKGEQGRAKVDTQDLVQCSLRLRPDRVIMGEIRGREVLDFIAASSTGHEGNITTIHANSPRIALMRMTQMYKLNNVPAMRDEDILREINAVVDVIIQVSKQSEGRLATQIYYKHGHLLQ